MQPKQVLLDITYLLSNPFPNCYTTCLQNIYVYVYCYIVFHIRVNCIFLCTILLHIIKNYDNDFKLGKIFILFLISLEF